MFSVDKRPKYGNINVMCAVARRSERPGKIYVGNKDTDKHRAGTVSEFP